LLNLSRGLLRHRSVQPVVPRAHLVASRPLVARTLAWAEWLSTFGSTGVGRKPTRLHPIARVGEGPMWDPLCGISGRGGCQSTTCIRDEVLLPDQEQALVEEFAPLPFREFEFRGKRRIVSFGWRYDFNGRELQQAAEIPAFLLGLREAAAEFAGLSEDQLQHV
jgi:hypothetical protein